MVNMDVHIRNFCHKYEVMISLVAVSVALAFYVQFLPISTQMMDNESKLVPPNPTKHLPLSGSKMQFFKRAAVCADADTCAKIARDILSKEGSAVDAAIAALICNSVVNMHSAGVGGGFFMTIYKRDENKGYCLNARETAPLTATNDLFQKENSTSNGSLSVGVPGEIKGYLQAHKKFGKLPWKDIVQPSIDLCKKGYLIGEHQYTSSFKNILNIRDDNIREWFLEKDGSFKQPGNKVVPVKLCEFLTKLSNYGPEDFYTGHLSQMFITDIKEGGGIITADDLNSYEAEWQEPIEITLSNGDHLYTFPAPGSGAILSFILNVLDGYNFTRESIIDADNIAQTYHKIVETFKYAHAKRTDLGDPKFVDVKKITQQLTSKEFAECIRSKIKKNQTNCDPHYYGAHYFSDEDHGTAHVSVMAENGDAVAATSTVNIYFGAGMTSKQTGIILNSVMDDFSYPHVINYFGLTGSPANKMEPGKRPFSSMSPSILTDRDGNVKIAIGGAGGPKITTSTALTLIRLLWFGDNLKEAIETPRIHHQLFPMEIHYEYGIIEEVVQKLKSMGHKMQRRTESIVYALQKKEEHIVGIADHRKPGGGVYGI